MSIGSGCDDSGSVVLVGIVGLYFEGLVVFLADDLVDISPGKLDLHYITTQ